MGLWGQAKAARRIARNLLRSRRNRALLAERLEGVTPPGPGSIEIAVYFADTRVNLYQIRQWYAPLAELAREHPVAIISRSPGTMMTLLDEAPVPAVYLRRVTDLERFVAEQRLRLVLYVNQNTKNFQMFRYGRMWHVFVNHGESDKMYMTTNQYKAYDYAFVAGQAAKDRLARKLWNYDLDRRVLEIGRPQADHFAGELPFTPDDRTVVLYAPTWEGDRPAAAYGSIASHGERLCSRPAATESSTGRTRAAVSSTAGTARRTSASSRPSHRRTPPTLPPTTSTTRARRSAGSSSQPMSPSPTSRRWSTTDSRPASRSSSRDRPRLPPRSTSRAT